MDSAAHAAMAFPLACCVLDRTGRLVHGNAAFWGLVGRRPPSADAAPEPPPPPLRDGPLPQRALEVLERGLPDETSGHVGDRHVSVQLLPMDGRVTMFFFEAGSGESDTALVEYKRLFDTVTDAIGILDGEGVFLEVNQAILRLYGYERHEVLGRTPAMLADEGRVDLEDTFAKVEAALRGEQQRFEWWGRRKSGDSFPQETVLIPGTYYGRAVVIGLGRDITERKRTEQQLREAQARQADAERLRALGQLAAGVAHDFNNALMAILGHAQVMKRRVDNPTFIREGLDVIEDAARGAGVTAARIQSFGRDRGSDEMRSIDVRDPLREAIAMTKPRWERDAAARGIELEVHVEIPETPLPVSGNDAELREVIVNLLLNALDAMVDGGRIEVVAWRNSDEILVDVRDQGPGMDEATRQRIFEPFFSTKGDDGTGLGLSVSHGIVRRHGGEIRVESEPGRGTHVALVLPRERDSQRLDAVDASTPPPARVLVVDDEDAVRRALVQLLEDLGSTPVAVADGDSALERLREQPFDVVLTDLSLPHTGGLELGRRVRALQPDLPVIVVTGYANRDVASAAADEAQGLLHKPVERTTLARVLTRVLGETDSAAG